MVAVFLFPNGMFAVTDHRGEQIPELQGKDTPERRAAIDARLEDDTELFGYRPASRRGVVVD